MMINRNGTLKSFCGNDLMIQQMNSKLNRLKKSNPEAFFYWYKIYELSSNEN